MAKQVKQERVADNIFYFQSQVYAQVNAGVVAAPDMAVVIDTLPVPSETLAMRDFIEQKLQVPVRYVINTHYHADHTWGNVFFPGAKVISGKLCYDLLKERGIPALARARKEDSTYRQVKIVLPHITFDDGELGIRVGKKTLKIFPLPGHSPDMCAVVVKEDRVMFSGDTLMPIPYIVDGDLETSIASLKLVTTLGLENIVPGHGDIILRGEVDRLMNEDIEYLNTIRRAVRAANRRKYPLDLLETNNVESSGKSRVLLGGLAEKLHQNNLMSLYKQLYGEEPQGSEFFFEEK